MNKQHNFNFDGGDILSKMGASWFVSFKYYLEVDHQHNNWCNCNSLASRKSCFESSYEYHNYWLKQILNMSEIRLSKNKLGLSGNDIIKMAAIILYKTQK